MVEFTNETCLKFFKKSHEIQQDYKYNKKI